jgi:hypothetical protein
MNFNGSFASRFAFDNQFESMQEDDSWSINNQDQEDIHEADYDPAISPFSPKRKRSSASQSYPRKRINSFLEPDIDLSPEDESDHVIQGNCDDYNSQSSTQGSYYDRISENVIPELCRSVSEIDSRCSSVFPFKYFNPVQSECLEAIYNSDVSYSTSVT